MEVTQTSSEVNILTVEASYRIRLPQPLCKRLGWIVGDQPIGAWLLLGSPGRCRLVSAAEVDSDPALESLKARIAEELDARNANALEFQPEVSVALIVRLVEVQLMRHEASGWRLTLPRPIAAIMRLRPSDSSLAAFFLQGHIEFWTMETLRSSVSTPLTEII
jgi:hypothetical protein